MKILLVDDEEIIHLSYTEHLQDGGFEVLNAYNGNDALKLAREENPDLVILDLLMPGKDGRDVCKELKNDEETRHIKIIMLTGKDEQHDRVLGFELGADEYLPKPYPVNFLEVAVRKQLGLHPYPDMD
ncbi:MAG: response regulator [Proteobacteria bacterium]|nr:response regulator [Pseudomonadota bacterium]MBU1738981.1 response regulator [Pseudomonadota bacterium]